MRKGDIMRNFLYLTLATCVIIFVLVGCTKVTTSESISYQKITAEEAKKIIDSENVIILDVRTQEEYNEGHIKNAILLPDTEITSKAYEVLKDKDAKILVYCRSGRRSAQASKKLINMGYTNVYDFGGIIDWKYEIEK